MRKFWSICPVSRLFLPSPWPFLSILPFFSPPVNRLGAFFSPEGPVSVALRRKHRRGPSGRPLRSLPRPVPTCGTVAVFFMCASAQKRIFASAGGFTPAPARRRVRCGASSQCWVWPAARGGAVAKMKRGRWPLRSLPRPVPTCGAVAVFFCAHPRPGSPGWHRRGPCGRLCPCPGPSPRAVRGAFPMLGVACGPGWGGCEDETGLSAFAATASARSHVRRGCR